MPAREGGIDDDEVALGRAPDHEGAVTEDGLAHDRAVGQQPHGDHDAPPPKRISAEERPAQREEGPRPDATPVQGDVHRLPGRDTLVAVRTK